MNRESKAPSGPRPARRSPTRENIDPSKKPVASRRLSADVPMLSASSSNNHSLFSFGGRNVTTNGTADANTSYDFLPSVSFDDLHSSLESASNDFKLTQFPSPTGNGSILEPDEGSSGIMADQSSASRVAGSTRVATQPSTTRPGRTGSILRRPSVNSRQPSTSSSVSGTSAGVDPPTAPAAMRARRQSHYPPVSNSGMGKPPRKSVGPGSFSPDYLTRPVGRRRPSIASSAGGVSESTRTSIDIPASDVPRAVTATRASKAKSVQAPFRPIQSTLSADTTLLAPDQSFLGGIPPRSPRAANTRGSTPLSAGKRISVLPGLPNQSHVSGLGARTVSPTDARRAKRMSVMHPPRVLPQATDAPPAAADGRASSRSPSMLPRKTSTPSSSRTTPDINRKSYSSGLSVGSTTSFNTVRTSTGSILPRVQPTGSARLPPPKSVNVFNPTTGEDDEDVPPVPAIPKAYESPKDTAPEISFLDKMKTSLAFDASSIHSNSTGSISGAVTEPPTKVSRKASTRKSMAHTKAEQKGSGSRNLQPLRLPPIALGPLSAPTVEKIAALQGQGTLERNASSPPARQMNKTPTTPMTASKSSFFSRNRGEDKGDFQNLRSSSTIHRVRPESPSPVDASSSESTAALTAQLASMRSGVSPFLSSSVPKDSVETHFIARSKTGGDIATTSMEPIDPILPAKPSGPRGFKVTKPPPKSPGPLSSPDEPPTPSSMTSLRRKLSLTWKRNGAKSSNSGPLADKGSEQGHVKQGSAASTQSTATLTAANVSKVRSPSSATAAKPPGGTYLESRRRKSSASSLNAVLAQDRGRNDNRDSADRGAKKNGSLEAVAERAALSHTASTARTHMKHKSSMRQMDVWAIDLDKDDLVAEDEMKRLGSKRKETELAARTLDTLRKRATAKERVSAQDAIRIATLNIYERGEIVDYSDIYFCGTQNAAKVVGGANAEQPNFGYDDERGDYSIVPGDHLAYRYEIVDILGKGSFGQVVRCIDHKTGGLVALKIIRNKKRFHQQALVEVNILQKLREWDPRNKHSMVNFTHSFYFRGHLCISTELLDMNLYEFIKANAFRGFSLKLIRRFTKQMLSSLNLLKQHKVIHCDLKPENILLRHPLHSEIKVIDFGSSCFENEKVYTYIQSRFYRSPEVILGMTYGMPIDMWSLGCILAELYTGVPIFPGENEQEQLACIMEVFGPPERHLIEKSTRKKLFFDSMGKPRLTVSSKGRRRRPSSKTLAQALKCDDDPFLDFLARCLRWDPDRRMKPDEAIRHEFITGQKTSVPVPRVSARDASPVKRHNTISTPRPLPEPPGSKVNATLRPRDATTGSIGLSPQKPALTGSRRTSSVSAAISVGGTGLLGAKRTNGGQAGGSNLPRVAGAGRSVSAKTDLAAVGAAVAMGGRRA